ncbi:MAG TPA: PQQ-binding-like beta-propeller repeat protein [Caldisericia bacterium]|nr:PQQ-binding-like beta-propeller repeat protein [Caldisericia bacterium]HPF49342.1 PQQ-binding-like beta-propeller repeat protein [Caldisericia bacterium]HPI84418.1 PQQ-binding-like beta-propeller repeat protein [Caldisericia bacterium]HPQ93821.1 PQQ-binding-like beta-propeller repeat protein [Caldisericia bacterium]HRV75615.1 PQQ-binding-like beta-propeller repeat protein [Caldisericia bacterium]
MRKTYAIIALLALVATLFVFPTAAPETSAGGYFQAISPAIYGDNVITAKGEKNLYALKISDGSEVWKVETTDRVYSSPTVDGDKVYVVLATEIFPYRHLHCIDAATGKVEWKQPIQKGVFSKPLVQDGYIVVGTTGINAGTGTIEVYKTDGTYLWTKWFKGWVTGAPLLVGENLMVGSFFGQIEIVKIENGKRSYDWKKPFPTYGSGPYPWNGEDSNGNRKGSAIECDLTLKDGKIFFGSYDSHLYCINVSDGEPNWGFEENNADWSHKVRWCRSAPLVIGDYFFVGCEGSNEKVNGLYKFSVASGKKLGFFETKEYVNSSPIQFGENVIFGTDSGKVACVDQSLTEVWSTQVSPEYVSGSFVKSGNNVIFTSRGKNDFSKTICIDGTNGSIKWEKQQ